MSQPTVGQALVKLLEDHAVELVFGIPGTHSIELYRGLEDSSIKHISPRHEQGGGFMADGYARSSGKPGVCFVITGPGVTNITTPMGEAYMDSVPMLVISPVNPPDADNVNRGRLHEITRQDAVTKPLAALSTTVANANQIPEVIAEAFRIFQSERPRPVHINIPLDVLTDTVATPWTAGGNAALPLAADAQIEQAANLIQAAKHPVIVAGGGAANSAGTIVQLGERIGCPMLTSVAGRGVIPHDHPLGLGAQLRAPYIQEALQHADLAIMLGTEFAQTDHWSDATLLPDKQIWINLCPHTLQNRGAALTIRADCGDAAKRIAAVLASRDFRTLNLAAWCASMRRRHGHDMTDKERMHWQVLEIIADCLPKSATVVSDMTQIAYTAVDYLPMQRPNQWLHPTGYGTLGYALPAAMGVALARPEHAVLALVGDAGLQYTMQEMSLAAELALPVTVLLWNNDALQQICDDMDNAGIRRIGIFQKNPDFLRLAEASHWSAHTLVDLDDLQNQLHQRLADQAHDLPPMLLVLNTSVLESVSGT